MGCVALTPDMAKFWLRLGQGPTSYKSEYYCDGPNSTLNNKLTIIIIIMVLICISNSHMVFITHKLNLDPHPSCVMITSSPLGLCSKIRVDRLGSRPRCPDICVFWVWM